MISGQCGKYLLQIDHSGNFTQARVIDTETGKSEVANFVDQSFIFTEKVAEVAAAVEAAAAAVAIIP